MKRIVILGALLLALSACGSEVAAPTSPPVSTTDPALVSLYRAALSTARSCGDPGATLAYVSHGGGRYSLVGSGTFTCGEGPSLGPNGIARTYAQFVSTGSIDRFGTFVETDFSLGGDTRSTDLHPLVAPPSDWRPAFNADLIRQLVVKAAANCGDPHPTDISYTETTMQSADIGPGVTDYKAEFGNQPVYALVAHGRFTCKHWVISEPVPAVRTRLRMIIAADGSGLRTGRIGIDSGDSEWPAQDALTPLPPVAGAPIAQMKALIIEQATHCGDPHPTDLAYAKAPQGKADPREQRLYTIPAFKTPVYVVVARGHFTCIDDRHVKREYPANHLLLQLPADGSPLTPFHIRVDDRTDQERAGVPLTPLP